MSFIWFWTFWHWSKESFESGRLLHGPVHGIGSHWDEWFRHEASATDRRAIDDISRSTRTQQQFVLWLARRWARDAHWRGARPPVRYVLGQVAHLPPFREWPTLEKYRARCGVPGISAVVIAEGSAGDSTDVRAVDVLALPRDEDAAAPAIVSDGFEADAATLATARRAAMSLLGGRALGVFLALWVASGRRPYPGWMRVAVAAGWVVAGGLIVGLLVGPDPGDSLTALAASLTTLWLVLVTGASAVAATTGIRAWRVGRELRRRLMESQIRLRMSGGLRLAGDSAGLPFCINMLFAVARAHTGVVRRSWLWRSVHGTLRTGASSWAATGAIGDGGRLEPVALTPKLRACLRHPHVTHILAPWQREAAQHAIDGLARATSAPEVGAPRPPRPASVALAYAAARRRLCGHRCWHVAQAAMAIGGLTSRAQLAASVVALVVSATMVAAVPGLLSILDPPPPPAVVAPSSPSPYYLWVSLDTRHPDDFYVVLESEFWANRRAGVSRHSGANASVRAELRLNRLRRAATRDEEHGVVWIERRRRFLTRDFAPGERVGRFFLSYVNQLPHD